MKYKKIVLNTIQGLLLTMLMAISITGSAQPQAIKGGDFLIGFDNIEVQGEIYNVRFRSHGFPPSDLISESSNAENIADIGNKILLDLIQKNALPVGSQEFGEYCNPSKTCSIYTAYDYDSNRYTENTWFLVSRFKMNSNYVILKSTISKKHSVLNENDMLNKNQFYADWANLNGSNWITLDEVED